MSPPEGDAPTPAEAYVRRRDERLEAATRWRRTAGRLGLARLATALLAAVLLTLSLATTTVSAAWLLVPAAGFVILVVLHHRATSRRGRAERAAAFHDRGLARLEDRWAGQGIAGDRYADPDHPCAGDLDLFGPGSLFELLCTARTRNGEDALAGWLRVAADPETVRARQVAVEELRPDLDRREEIAMLGEDVSVDIHADDLAAWGAAPPGLPKGPLVWLVRALAALAVAALVLAGVTGESRPLVTILVAELAVALALRRRVDPVLEAASRPASELDLLSHLLRRIESEPFEAARLREVQERLRSAGATPSRRIARLRFLMQLLDTRRNQLFAPFAGVLLWGTQLAFALERWRAESGAAVGRWLEAVGEIEALLALASHAYEHPADPFPELVVDGPLLDGEGLGHPLLPESRCVRNDVRLGAEPALLLVSGSNMSGKSTLLRTVGVNVVLALAGGPVRATRLRVSPLRVAASMRSQDSLLDGRSRFYAEIERIKQVVDLAQGDAPALFLLDELLHGTNSHDRAIGAQAVVRGLVARGAVGLVTTHDLALARIADGLGPRAENVHFEDRIEDGRVVFDYRLRPGVVTKSNALDLMRAVGLDVDEGAEGA